MFDLNYIAKIIMFIGIVMVVIGIMLMFLGKFTQFGRLPGDILIKRENYSVYFPLMSFILLSIILTIILNIFIRR